jgi:hypothetical protein
MKKAERSTVTDELLAEYDFASMPGGVRGKYAAQFAKGSHLVLLEPEVAEAFPTGDAVNEALRGILNTTRAVRRSGGLADKTLKAVSPKRRQGKPPKRSRAARG